mgnify:CR=1 FL=1
MIAIEGGDFLESIIVSLIGLAGSAIRAARPQGILDEGVRHRVLDAEDHGHCRDEYRREYTQHNEKRRRRARPPSRRAACRLPAWTC